MSNKSVSDLISIYNDGPTLDEIRNLRKEIIKGYTFNPSLFKALGVKDYLYHCKKISTQCNDLPVSLEVIADTKDEMIRQGRLLREISDNIYVKIPITYTNGESTIDVIKVLSEEHTKLNITAIFTKEQVKGIIPCLIHSKSIISIFSGRLFDIGQDAIELTKEMSEIVHSESNCLTLWASPRMVYDVKNAIKANCDIITMKTELIKKIKLFDKTSEDYSLETVKMFYTDAVESGYNF